MFGKSMYHKKTPPDVNQYRLVKAVLGKARSSSVVSAQNCLVDLLKEVRQ